MIFILALLVAISLALFIGWKTDWWDYIDPLLNLITLSVALFVGIQQLPVRGRSTCPTA